MLLSNSGIDEDDGAGEGMVLCSELCTVVVQCLGNVYIFVLIAEDSGVPRSLFWLGEGG